MTIHHCPKCELRFERKTELDDHCWHDHPQFRHEYPAQPAAVQVVDAPPRAVPVHEAPPKAGVVGGLLGWIASPDSADTSHPRH